MSGGRRWAGQGRAAAVGGQPGEARVRWGEAATGGAATQSMDAPVTEVIPVIVDNEIVFTHAFLTDPRILGLIHLVVQRSGILILITFLCST